MKGVTHFMAGICAASFMPASVRAAVAGNPLYFLIGGATALLPDTLDFKILRYFYPCECMIVPDPSAPDAGRIARELAQAIARACRHRRPVVVRLCTLRLPGDSWQAYRVDLSPDGRRLRVAFEAPCDSGGQPTGPAPELPAGTAELPARLVFDYGNDLRIDIMDGPVLRIVPVAPDRVIGEFLPWHRAASHSLAACGLTGAMAWTLWGSAAGVVALAAGLTHLVLDQAGHMGSAWMWPFSKRRLPGWRRCHAVDIWPNVTTVWLCLLVTGINLVRFDSVSPGVLNPLRVMFWGGLLPLAGLRLMATLMPRIIRSKSGSTG